MIFWSVVLSLKFPHPASRAKSRIAWVDLTEAIAITMVVLYHCTAYVADNSFSTVTSEFHLWYFLRSILAICVPLFFVINGFLLFRQPFDAHKHYRKILKFILIAGFWYLITLGFMVLLHRDLLAQEGINSVLQSVKYSINHLWYLGALICLYIFFPLLKITYDHYPKVFRTFLLICFCFTFGNTVLNQLFTFGSTIILGHTNLYHEVNFFRIFNPFRGMYGYSFVYFCLGALLHDYLPRLQTLARRTRRWWGISLILLGFIGNYLIGLLYSYASGHVWDTVWNGYDTVFTLAATIGLILLVLDFTKTTSLLTTISRNTLGIYLIHMLIINLLVYLFGPHLVWLTNPVAPNLPILLVLFIQLLYAGIVMFISLLITLILRHIPILRRLIS